MACPVLSLEQLTLRYGGVVAVRELSLEVAAGEVLGLLGPNGSGKSSTLAAVAGALAPAAGTVRVAGLREADAPRAYRRQIGLVPQELALFGELSVRQNLLFFGSLYGLRGPGLRRRADEVLGFVGLAGHAGRRPRTLSGGMQRRLNLACALLHGPALLLLDEPTVGLDVQSRDAVFACLRRLRAAGCGLLFTTHHLEEAEQLCDRIAVLNQGRLVALGTLAELAATPDRRWRADPAHAEEGRRPELERIYLELTSGSPTQP
jgi:ABC-2 type transport system ATP-binding protein